MTTTVFGTKQGMTEAYLGDNRVPVTRVKLFPLTVAQVKTADKDGYQAVQIVYGKGKKHPSQAIVGHLKAAKAQGGKLREIPYLDAAVGTKLEPADYVKPGTVLSVQGTAKGKGFAGVVKRYGFAGGSKTHGQSDRHRAPGSIGQGTTPGRVHRGKKMAGRMGGQTVMVKNVLCVATSGDMVWLTGPVPGVIGAELTLRITGQQDSPALTFLNGYQAQAEVAEAEPAVEVAASEPAPVEEAVSTDPDTKIEEPSSKES